MGERALRMQAVTPQWSVAKRNGARSKSGSLTFAKRGFVRGGLGNAQIIILDRGS